MLKATLAGRVGKDAVHNSLRDGTDICNFSVACDVGYGENKTTVWVDVAKFGKGAKGLSGYVRQGDPITVVGDLSTREHDGKTYIKCRADEVVLQSSKGGAESRSNGSQSYGNTSQNNGYGGGADGGGYDDLDADSIPF